MKSKSKTYKLGELMDKLKAERPEFASIYNQMFIMTMHNQMIKLFTDPKIQNLIHRKFIDHYVTYQHHFSESDFPEMIKELNDLKLKSKPSKN